MKTLYLVRHGETEYNRLGMVQGRGIDSSLNVLGRAQALALWQHYQRVPLDAVVTSSLQRTHQTVHHFIESGLPWIATDLIDEISWGEHEGRPFSSANKGQYEALKAAWINGDWDAKLPFGESLRDLTERLRAFLDELTQRPEERLLICSHGRTLTCLVTLLQHYTFAQTDTLRIENTGVSKGVFVAPDHAMTFEFINDLSHLAL